MADTIAPVSTLPDNTAPNGQYVPPVVQMWQQHYTDMPFADFAKKLYEKHYSDMPFEQFAAQAQIIPTDNHGMGTRAQREPDTIDTGRGMQEPSIPYATAMADTIASQNQNAVGQPTDPTTAAATQGGNAAVGGFMSMIPGAQKLGSYIDSGLSQVGINGPGVNGPISQPDRLAQIHGAEDANIALHPNARMAGQAGSVAAQALLAPEVLPETLGTVGSAAATGGLYGGLGAAVDNNGTLADKARAGLTGGAIGAVGGGVLGGVAKGLGAAVNAGKQFLAPAGVSAGQDAVAAAQRLGTNIPTIAATDAPAVQRGGQALAGTIFGGPVRQAVIKGQEDLGNAARNLAGQTGTVGDATATGTNLKAAIDNTVRNTSKQAVSKEYQQLDNMVPGGAVSDLPNTQQTLQQIGARRQASGANGYGTSSSDALELATRPQGATIEGIKDLRSRIGAQIDGSSPLPADWNEAEAKLLYKGLSSDLERAYANNGGPAALAQFQKANSVASQTARTNQELARKLLGTSQSAESLFNTLAAAAKTGGRQNGKLLLQARQAVPPGQWNDFAASIIDRMGRDNQGNFSPVKFLTAHNDMSALGKGILFTPAQKAALDDLVKVSERYRNLSSIANHSNTGNVNSAISFAAGSLLSPVHALTTALGGNLMAKMLAKPASVNGMTKWSNAYGRFASNANAATARTLTTATRAFALVVANELGDHRQAKQIEQSLLEAPMQGRPQ